MLRGLCETVMRCPSSLTLAGLSVLAELRAFCSVAIQGFWLANTGNSTKTNDVMLLSSCRSSHESLGSTILIRAGDAPEQDLEAGRRKCDHKLASRIAHAKPQEGRRSTQHQTVTDRKRAKQATQATQTRTPTAVSQRNCCREVVSVARCTTQYFVQENTRRPA